MMRRRAPALLTLAALGWAGTAASQEPPRITPADVAVLARAAQARLPVPLADGADIVAVRAEGTELVNEVSVAERVLDVARLRAEVEPAIRGHVCRTLGPLVGLGLTVRHVYTDPAGTRFETRVTACP